MAENQQITDVNLRFQTAPVVSNNLACLLIWLPHTGKASANFMSLWLNVQKPHFPKALPSSHQWQG
ncbi:MAG: hypothetical protein H6577_05990 [Lewinellaceae bacterium]|nr:hypothetical protein [Saprospiraceae bacterium]MCB9337658.1 hypothetical protein [Lewinellaceae bacterium]